MLTVAQRLCDSGHYAAPTLRATATRLDRDWARFAAALDERNTVLALAVIFHQKTDRVIPI